MKPIACAALSLLLLAPWAMAQGSATASVKGQVTDSTGASVSGAEVLATGPSQKVTRTDAHGGYAIEGLAPGSYTIVVTKDGFSPSTAAAVPLAAGQVTPLDVPLSVAPIEETVTVRSAAPAVSLAPEENAGAIVLKGADLDALPDDPDEMAEALQALAGPSAGPNGGQLFIDGFTGGRIPPKSSIREIRLNANPFSAEYDRLGFGRIEIFTKPGTDTLRGETSFRFNDAGLNTRNAYAPNKPPYERREWGGNVSGPLMAKKASFFIDFEKRDVDDDQIVNATVLGADLVAVPYSQAILTPTRRTTVSPRLDWQLNPANTLTIRYTFASSEQTNAGVGGFSLPSRGYGTDQHQHTLQLTETATFGKAVNETRVRYWTEHQTKNGDDSLPTLQVQDSFTGGGAQVGPSSNDQTRFELQNVTSWTHGKHSFRAGVRLRTVRETDVARQGFGGTVLFAGSFGPSLDDDGQIVIGPDGQPVLANLTSIERYRRTIVDQSLGLGGPAIRALGGGPSQLQIVGGNPAAHVSQWDVAPFVQDDWRVRNDLILSLGLRYEAQDNISSNSNLAPRVGFAWSPGAKSPTGQARTVVRGGFGIFYDRIGEDLTLRANRFDGGLEQQYVVSDPAVLDALRFDPDGRVTGLPSAASLLAFAVPQTTWIEAPDLQTPYTVQTSLSLERQLPGNFVVSGTFITSEGRRQLRSRNVNAPLLNGDRPLGVAAGNVYQVESTGRMNQYQAIVGVNNRLSKTLTLFVRYFFAHASSDTDGSGTFPADQYDLAAEYGRAAIDVRHRVVLGGNITGPWGVRISPFVIASTGRPFNITTGFDQNRDSLFTDRPAFTSDPTRPGVVVTPYGLLDPNPVPGAVVIPRNLGEGPSFVVVNLRLSRTIPIFKKGGAAPIPEGGGPRGPGGRGGGGGGFGGGGGGRGPGGDGGGGGGGGRGLTISVSAQNLFNHVNAATPVGNLSSPLFGQSLASAGGFGFGGGGTTPGNRRIELQARFGF